MNAAEKAELNRVMATAVMGWKRMTHNEYFAVDYYSKDSLTDDWHNPDGTVAHHFNGQDDQCNDCSWNPCEDPADAFAVLQRCAEKCKYGFQIIGNEAVGFSVRKIEWQGYNMGTSELADGETLPLAICKFAMQIFKPTTEGV